MIISHERGVQPHMTLMYLIQLYESAASVHYENPCVVL